MALNSWWAGDRDQRYWMEITDREVLGVDLTAPQVNAAGRPEWSYTLVTETAPGDVVLHWLRRGGTSALVGWSVVTGPLSTGSITWQAHGTRGRARGKASTNPSWTMQCGGFNSLSRPVGLRDVSAAEGRLRRVREKLATQHGDPIYFPFSFYRPGEMRAAQAYLTKFPSELIGIFPELRGVFDRGVPVRSQGRRSVRIGVGNRRLSDPALRKAVEQHAVNSAKSHYFAAGATEIIELGAPYDLLVRGLGPDRHVEVKGSTLDAVAVELTVNEVVHARDFPKTDLVVVDQIEWSGDSTRGFVTAGGNLRIWSDWTPADDALTATLFRYELSDPV